MTTLCERARPARKQNSKMLSGNFIFMGFVVFHIGRSKNTPQLFPNSFSQFYFFEHLDPGVGVDPKQVIAPDGLYYPVPRSFRFSSEGTEQPIPDDQYACIISVQVNIVYAVMNAVMRRRIEDAFEWTQPFYEGRMYPELV
jgi:hypothetical protein